MANWKEPKNDYKKEDQVVPEIFNTLAENERYLQEKKITTEQVQDAVVNSTQATSRDTIGGSETVKGFFSKVRKWLADLKALAFKKTVATADIDDLAVTTAKIKSKAVTDAKIDSVSASKVTGLHKVATSGDYNDLINKPSMSGGGFNFKRYDFYLNEQPSDIDAGIYLCFVVFTNRASYSNVANLGLITCSPNCDNGSYSGVSSIYDSGEEFKIQLKMESSGNISLITSRNERECPTVAGYDGDGGFKVMLIKLSDLDAIDSDGSGGGGGSGTWKLLTDEPYQIYGDYATQTATVYIPGLKKGDTVKFTAMSIKLNEDYANECYFYNALNGNMVYGFTYDGFSYNEIGEMTGWYQIRDEYDNPPMSELELTSESPYVGKVGLVDYGTSNKLTIKVSCKEDNILTVEISDTAGFFIDMMPIYNIYVKR